MWNEYREDAPHFILSPISESDIVLDRFYFRTLKGFYIFGWRRMILSNGGNLMNDAGACH